jgi:hypothetical protein
MFRRSRAALKPLLVLLALAAGAAASPPAAGPKAAPAAAAAGPAAPVRVLATRHDLGPFFEAGKGKVRIVAFLSPTCSHCIANCQQLQKLVFDEIDSPEIEMHAVWIKVLETDGKERIASARQILTDPRVHHYWDPEHRLNPQILDVIGFDINLRFYDVFLLYDRAATWQKRLPRPGFWMHETRGAPGPMFNGQGFAVQVRKALDGEPLDTPQ